MTFAPADSKTNFLSTSEVFPQDPSQLLVKMTSLHTDVANCVNIREIAQYEENRQVLTGMQFSTPGNNQVKKFVFRKVFYFGALAAGATLNILHGIVGMVAFTHIYGTCVTNVVDYRPIPYVALPPVQNAIQLTVRPAPASDIVITNGVAAPAITSGIIILEYLLN